MRLPEFHDIEQNTDKWGQLHCGRLTSSSMGKVMANYGQAFGEPAKKLAVSIAVEMLTGNASFGGGFSNDHTDRGHEQEPIARMLYEETAFCDVLNGGFFCSETLGCSPDGLVADNGVIEIKSVIAPVHYANVKRAGLDPAYKWQKYANLMFTGREWLDFISYCGEFPADKQLFVYRIFAKNCSEQFAQLESRIGEFMELVEEAKITVSNSEYFITEGVGNGN